MMGLSQEGGHTLTPNPAEADVLVVNTCAFIDSAKEESINTILELAEFKKTGACKRLVVTGCLGERYRDELQAQIPEIDAVLGTGDVPEIVGAIEGDASQRDSADDWSPADPKPESRSPKPPHLSVRRRNAPRLRHAPALRLREGGRRLRLQVLVLHHSRRCAATTAAGPVDAIVREARALAARGRARDHPDLAGHDVLRARPGQRRARCRSCCAS